MPEQMSNCSIKDHQTACSIDVAWNRLAITTGILLTPGDDINSLSRPYILIANTMLSIVERRLKWQNTISYSCSTDQCNSPARLKHLLESLTLIDDFDEIAYIIQTDKPFDGHWCVFFSNTTTTQCQTKIDPNLCQQCIFGESNTKMINETCANCYTDVVGDNTIAREAHFNMTDQTHVDFWAIQCQSPNCNSIATGQQVHDKSTINFHFNKFLNKNSEDA